MDIEVAAVCGAAHGERSPDRENQRNGDRPDDTPPPPPRPPAMGHPRGHDRAEHPEAAQGQLFPDRPGAAQNGRESIDGGDTGGLHPRRLHPRR